MKLDMKDLMSYLYSTDQVDENLGLKEDIIKCENCGNELYIFEDNILFCEECNTLSKYNIDRKIKNKRLSYVKRQEISKYIY